MHLDPSFAPLLAAFDLDELDRSANVIYGTWADGHLAYMNAAWSAFARENGAVAFDDAWPTGRSVWDAVPAVLHRFYRDGFEWARESGEPWSHTYECSSADTTRIFRMTAYGLAEGRGVLLVNSLLAAVEASGGVDATSEQPYRNEHGQVVQCAHCRRVRHAGVPEADERWDWVPRWVHISPTNTSHGLCPVCDAYHYGALLPR